MSFSVSLNVSSVSEHEQTMVMMIVTPAAMRDFNTDDIVFPVTNEIQF